MTKPSKPKQKPGPKPNPKKKPKKPLAAGTVDMVETSPPMTSSLPALDPTASGQMIDAFALLRTLRIHKWMVLALAAAGTLLGFFAGQALTPKYTAVAEILIEPEDNALGNDVGDGQLGDDTLETEVRFLNSKSYMLQIVEQTSVFDDVVVGEGDETAPAPWSFVNQAFAWLNAGDSRTSGIADPDLAVLEERMERFAKDYVVQVAGESRVIEISYTSDDPGEAAEVVNLAARLHIDKKLDIKEDNNVQNSSWIAGRVDTLREELNAAEREIEKFRVEYSLETNNFDARTEELSEFVVELIRLKAELAREEATLAALADMRTKKQNVLNLPDIASSETIIDLQAELREVQRLRVELGGVYGERHPEMIAAAAEEARVTDRIEQEVDRIIQNLQDSIDIKKGQRAALEEELTGSRTEKVLQSDFEVQLREKERNAEAVREVYEGFLQRSKELNEERLAIDSDIVQLSEALPPALSDTPSPKLTALIGFCLAFLGGSVTAILREQQDQRLRSEQQVGAFLGLKAIGAIPEIRDLRRRQSGDGFLSTLRPGQLFRIGGGQQLRLHEYMLEKPMSAYTDAVRNVLLGLKTDMKAKGTKVVVTTSTLPNEGKTTFAVSLSALAASSGLRTLIIDLDLRHPSVREELRAPNVPGFADYIRGDRALEHTLWVHPKLSRLQAVMSREPQPDPMSVLESERFKTLLEEARAGYDLVVIDSAPVFAVSEAKTVAALGDSVIFVVRWGETDRDTARNGLLKLEENGIDNVSGVVLSQIDFKKHHLHHYRDAGHYYKEYKNYYKN